MKVSIFIAALTSSLLVTAAHASMLQVLAQDQHSGQSLSGAAIPTTFTIKYGPKGTSKANISKGPFVPFAKQPLQPGQTLTGKQLIDMQQQYDFILTAELLLWANENKGNNIAEFVGKKPDTNLMLFKKIGPES